MKQRLDCEDLGKATPEQQQWIGNRWKPIAGDHYVDAKGIPWVHAGDYRTYADPKRGDLPLLTVGQCMEILQRDAWVLAEIANRAWNCGFPQPDLIAWDIALLENGTFAVKAFKDCRSHEIIDALWDACLQVIPGGAR